MKLSFKDGKELEVQVVALAGDCIRISVINQVCENLVALFSDEERTAKIITDDGKVYDGYTNYQGISVAPGMIYTVTMYKEGKSIDQRMTEMEKRQEIADAALQDLILTTLAI
jgi:hypothetical protein